MGGRPDVSEIRPVIDEPVRGLVPPPWINSLSGIERMRLMSRHYLALMPTARLFGLGLGHVSAGSATATMKASGHMAFIPALNVVPLFMESLHGAVLTALDAGTDRHFPPRVLPSTSSSWRQAPRRPNRSEEGFRPRLCP